MSTLSNIKYSDSTEIELPSSPDTENQKKHWMNCKHPKLPIIRPQRDFTFIFIWKVIILITLIYSIVEIPYLLAFQVIPEVAPWFIAGVMIDMLLILDILVNFRTAYIDKLDRLRVVEDPTLIAKRYIKTWFFVDLLSSFPFVFFMFAITDTLEEDVVTLNSFQILRLFRYLKLLRIFRLFKLSSVFHEVSQIYEMSRIQKSVLRLLRIIVCMLFTAHWFACIWYSIGHHSHKAGNNSWVQIIVDNEDYDKGNFVRYSYAFYWAIVTLFTTGYGDISAHNIYEQWTASLGIMIGSCFFAYFISALTTELTDDLKSKYDAERVEKSMAFCTYYNLPRRLRAAVMIHSNYFSNANFPFDPEFVMDSLPNYLQKDIERYLRQKRLRDLDIFRSLPDSIVGQIAFKLKIKSCGARKTLYSKDEIGKEIFIQRTGESLLIEKDRILNQFKRGDVIGEDVIISGKRNHTVICQTFSEFYVLNVKDIVNVLKMNYASIEATNHWKEIKKIIQEPIIVDSDENVLQQQRCVHLGSIQHFENIYIPRFAKDESDEDKIEASSKSAMESEEYKEYENKNETEKERLKGYKSMDKQVKKYHGRKSKNSGKHRYEVIELNDTHDDMAGCVEMTDRWMNVSDDIVHDDIMDIDKSVQAETVKVDNHENEHGAFNETQLTDKEMQVSTSLKTQTKRTEAKDPNDKVTT